VRLLEGSSIPLAAATVLDVINSSGPANQISQATRSWERRISEMPRLASGIMFVRR